MILNLYADESQDDASGIFRMAGYLMTAEQWKSLDEKIGASLGNLNWFHMKEGHHRSNREIYRALLNCIEPATVLVGFNVALNKKQYDEMTNERVGKHRMRYWMGSSYSFLVQAAMSICGKWCKENGLADAWIAYFFEAGHPSEGDANASVKLFQKKQYRNHLEQARYASHSFLAKEGPLSRVLIPCDILAWHLTNWQRAGKKSPELRQLLKVKTLTQDVDAEGIRAVIADSKQRMRDFDKNGRPRKIA